jgi:hypothetical protein
MFIEKYTAIVSNQLSGEEEKIGFNHISILSKDFQDASTYLFNNFLFIIEKYVENYEI